MTEEFHRQLGEMLASLKHNTVLTEKIADKVEKISESLSNVKATTDAHGLYLQNLDSRIVTQRKDHQDLHERVTVIETKTASSSNIFKWMGGVLATLIGSAVTYLFFSNK